MPNNPPAKIVFYVLGILWLAFGLLAAWITFPTIPTKPLKGVALSLQAIAHEAIPGWQQDPKAGALAAFRRSCKIVLRWPDDRAMARGGVAGTAGDWKPACQNALALKDGDEVAAGKFFKTEFLAFSLSLGQNRRGLFTGYYEPTLNGSRVRGGKFQTAIYMRPNDLVTVNLGNFNSAFKSKRLVGRVRGGRLVPYADRAAIAAGSLNGRNLEIVYVDDAIAAFFLHIQGSGRVRLRDGSEIGVGYAAQNGHKYVDIGRELIRRGYIERGKVSMQSIRAWLKGHPKKRQAILNSNPSYIFFRETKPIGAVGALGAVLTPGRSLAVDRTRLPLAVPLFLVTQVPESASKSQSWRRLMVAQDVGGAIKGGIRGDIFFGIGEIAAYKAGHMNAGGQLYMLLPRKLGKTISKP